MAWPCSHGRTEGHIAWLWFKMVKSTISCVNHQKNISLYRLKNVVFLTSPIWKKCLHRRSIGCWDKSMPRTGPTQEINQTLCFGRYYELLGDRKQKRDKIDENLRCVRLRWHRTSGKSDFLLLAEQVWIEPCWSISGTVPTMSRNIMMSLTAREDARVKAHSSVFADTAGR